MDIDNEASSLRLTTPGEVISDSSAVLRGHGTYVEDEDVVASLAGVVSRVNKLVVVKALKSRYIPEVGDLVVGRVVDVGSKRWKVDINSRLDGILMLASVNLPGGIQAGPRPPRRRLEADELQMRNFFEEGDLLVAEVQSFFAEGSTALHTRSLKFGKLRNGQLVTIPSTLVRRLKSHFFSLTCGVDIILGMNGYIWVQKHTAANQKEGEEGFDSEAVYSNVNDDIDWMTRAAIGRVSNIILVFARYQFPLTDTLLNEAYDWITDNEIDVKNILSEEVAESLMIGLMQS
ncbi:uncharacterized protein EI90DRAFT_2997938 [Cantharellus anzutake]|uniref:uncharacterized protein n=1 Tax=Cantharellus anzutake TaxID=1750568 RepID=UPI0019086F26|nr:uncharacterized protein EI90DRAFT_2997938 [Cantharellus anzutake]KAF8328407.1 hypothetical protein EI90DRAFT_2997938 [Cantharellus anzutake]